MAYPVAESAFDPQTYYDSLIRGDLNIDGVIDIFDLISMKKLILSGTASASSLAAADVNRDGDITIGDAVLIQRFIEGSVTDFLNAS